MGRGRMNWKRGLTRIYVLLWILFAAGGLYLTVTSPLQLATARAGVMVYSEVHGGITNNQIRHIFLSGGDTTTIQYPKSFIPDDPEGNTREAERYVDRINNHVREYAKMWAIFLAVCGVLPGLLLAMVSWIAAGFKK